MKILYIEDNPGDQRLITEILRETSISESELVISGSLSDGLQKISGSSFNIILLDLVLPDSKGIQTFLSLQNNGIKAPIIILTGLDDLNTALLAVKNGAQDYLIKNSVNSEYLEKSILYAIERHALQQEILTKTLELRESEYRLNRAQYIAHIGSWALQFPSMAISWSDQMFELFDVPREVTPTYELFLVRIVPEDKEGYSNLMQQAFLQKSREFTYICRIQISDGDIRFIEIIAEIVYDPAGSVQMLVGTAQNITERKKTEESLSLVNQKLNLLSSITRHDILNQINAIQIILHLALKLEESEKVRTYISHAIQASDEVEATIEFTREYEAFGKVSSRWLFLYPVIESAKADISLDTCFVDNQISPMLEIYTDPIIRKVFSTLIDNAVRHGEHITTIRFYAEPQKNVLIITCEDDGIGIPEAEKEVIFDQGYGKNTGIGLFLAREILTITGLTIRECGVEGQGSRFEILVPDGKFRMATKDSL